VDECSEHFNFIRTIPSGFDHSPSIRECIGDKLHDDLFHFPLGTALVVHVACDKVYARDTVDVEKNAWMYAAPCHGHGTDDGVLAYQTIHGALRRILCAGSVPHPGG